MSRHPEPDEPLTDRLRRVADDQFGRAPDPLGTANDGAGPAGIEQRRCPLPLASEGM
jgi:hypothetical protein